MRRREAILALAGLAGTLIVRPSPAAGQQATPSLGALPELPVPFGLSGVDLPASPEDVAAHFARLPRVVHGFSRNPVIPAGEDRVQVTYGSLDSTFGAPLVIQALDFRESDFFPVDFTPGAYVAAASGTDDYGAESFGQDLGIVWIQAETVAATAGDAPGTPGAARTIYTLAWGAIDGFWLFTVAATTPAGLSALAAAFVTASETDHP